MTKNRAFEFVLINMPWLNQDAGPFFEQFELANPNQQVVMFPSLGRDAMLVAPCPAGSTASYRHLAAFVPGAPENQVHELWQVVGDAMLSRVGSEPLWLSTAGLGVSWLHVRMDSRPKDYAHEPYRKIT